MCIRDRARTNRKARPNVSIPTARATGRALDIIVDDRGRYAWKFTNQQANTVKRRLPIGDYAIEHAGALAAVVERKSVDDLASTLTSGKLRFLLAELAEVPRSAVVVEDRYSAIFKLSFVQPRVMAEGIAEAAARFPTVPIHFLENRKLAEEWTYRYLGAALDEAITEPAAAARTGELPIDASALPAPEPTTAEVRAWAKASGIDVPRGGRLRPEVWEAWRDAHG